MSKYILTLLLLYSTSTFAQTPSWKASDPYAFSGPTNSKSELKAEFLYAGLRYIQQVTTYPRPYLNVSYRRFDELAAKIITAGCYSDLDAIMKDYNNIDLPCERVVRQHTSSSDIYFDKGSDEGGRSLRDMRALFNQLNNLSNAMFATCDVKQLYSLPSAPSDFIPAPAAAPPAKTLLEFLRDTQKTYPLDRVYYEKSHSTGDMIYVCRHPSCKENTRQVSKTHEHRIN